MDFVFSVAPARAVFGRGAVARLGPELDALGARRVMVACTAGARRRLAPVLDQLGDRLAEVFDEARPHCPEDTVRAAVGRFRRSGADAVVAIGGGSTIGVGKAIAVETGCASVAVPTTYSGSEMTPLYGIKIGREKRTSRDPKALPKTVVYDPDLTLSLPARETAETGMNSLAHAVEALYPKEPNPVAALLAEEAIRAHAAGLPGSVRAPADRAARERALYGGFLGGLLVAMVGIALHHKLCHVLGGHHGVPHGASNSVMLPHVVAYNAPAAPAAMRAIERALGVGDAATGLFDLARTIGAPASLKELGLPESGLRPVAEETAATIAYNPRPVTADGLSRLLRDAYDGRRPATASGREG